MKKLYCLILASLLFVGISEGQIRTPALSPGATLDQTVGLTEVSLEYSRPSKRNRDIFGALVPYGEIWRTGANAATKISFSTDVMIAGEKLEAGDYAILTKPGQDSWDVMFYPYEGGNFGEYVEKTPALTATVDAYDLGEISLETFTMGIGNISTSGATLEIVWDTKYVGIPFTVGTDAAVMASIESTMAGPDANDYSAAASYYFQEGKDLDQALSWITKSLDMDPGRFWIWRTKSLIQADLGDKSGAIESAKKSLELAKEAGNNDYIRMNESSIKDWSM